MGFRTLEISRAAELHIKNGQLEVASAEGTALIPIEDLSQILVHGANIRLSTMDLSILTSNKVAVMTLDEKYLPTAIVLPFEGHSRQSMLMHAQVHTRPQKYLDLWMQLVRQKISNQSRALSIMGMAGSEKIAAYVDLITEANVDYIEAIAAKDYFSCFHEELNRRTDDPVNSRLNYGYAVVRSAIARSLVSSGFHPTFGIYHNSQLNAFNLADDLIEPFRAIVDVTAHEHMGSNVKLTKAERYALAHVLHNACLIDETEVNVLSGIDLMVNSLRRIIQEESDEKLQLPVVLPVQSMEGITE